MGGAPKISICFNGIKSVNINLIARVSVVYLTICILHCDEDFYKYTRKIKFNVQPAISAAYIQMHFRLDFFMELFFMEENVTEEQPNLDPYCLQYMLHIK